MKKTTNSASIWQTVFPAIRSLKTVFLFPDVQDMASVFRALFLLLKNTMESMDSLQTKVNSGSRLRFKDTGTQTGTYSDTHAHMRNHPQKKLRSWRINFFTITAFSCLTIGSFSVRFRYFVTGNAPCSYYDIIVTIYNL